MMVHQCGACYHRDIGPPTAYHPPNKTNGILTMDVTSNTLTYDVTRISFILLCSGLCYIAMSSPLFPQRMRKLTGIPDIYAMQSFIFPITSYAEIGCESLTLTFELPAYVNLIAFLKDA